MRNDDLSARRIPRSLLFCTLKSAATLARRARVSLVKGIRSTASAAASEAGQDEHSANESSFRWPRRLSAGLFVVTSDHSLIECRLIVIPLSLTIRSTALLPLVFSPSKDVTAPPRHRSELPQDAACRTVATRSAGTWTSCYDHQL